MQREVTLWDARPSQKNIPEKLPLFKTGSEQLAIWRNIRGMWTGRDPDPIEWLEKSREDAKRELLPLRT